MTEYDQTFLSRMTSYEFDVFCYKIKNRRRKLLEAMGVCTLDYEDECLLPDCVLDEIERRKAT